MIIKELFARLGFQTDTASLSVANAAISKFKMGALAAGAVAGAAFAAVSGAIAEVARDGSKINDTSKAIGVNAEKLQELGHAAQLSGVGFDEMRTGLTILSRQAYAAAGGSKESAAGFARLGVRVRDASGKMKDPAVLIEELSGSLSAMPDGAEKTALAMQLFGRSGAKMLPMLGDGADGLKAMMQDARDLGIVLSGDTVKAADEWGDQLDRLRAALKGVRYAIGGPLLGATAEWIKSMVDVVKANRQVVATGVHKFIRGTGTAFKAAWQLTRPMLAGLKYLLVDLGLLKVAMVGVGLYAASHLGTMFAAGAASMVGWVSKMIAGFGTLATAQGLAAAKSFALGLAWFALAAVIALVADDLYAFFTGGESLMGEFGEKWAKTVGDFLKPEADDHWLTKELKRQVAGLFDLQGAWLRTKKSMSIGWDVVIASLRTVSSFIEAIVAGLKLIGTVTLAGAKYTATVGPVDAIRSAFGGGANPAATAASTAKSTGGIGSVSVPISIVAAPGMDERELASHARREFEAFWDTKMREAEMSIAPSGG